MLTNVILCYTDVLVTLVLTIGGGGSPSARTEALAFLPAHGCWQLGCSTRSLQLLGLEEQCFASCSLTRGQEGQGLRKPTDVAEFAFRAFFFPFLSFYLFICCCYINSLAEATVQIWSLGSQQGFVRVLTPYRPDLAAAEKPCTLLSWQHITFPFTPPFHKGRCSPTRPI